MLQQTAIADLERATMEARLAAGTQNATAADLAKTMAAERRVANAAVTVAAMQRHRLLLRQQQQPQPQTQQPQIKRAQQHKQH